MQRAGRRNRAAFEHQTRLRNAARRRGAFERLVFDRVLVGLGEQRERRLAGEGFRQTASLQFLFVALLHQRLLTLALETGQRHLQLFLRRALIHAAALAAEVHRRAMHAQHQRGALDRTEALTEVLGAQRCKRKFVVRRAFPQEVQVDVLRGRVGLLHQFGRARLLEFDQHVFRAHLGAPAAR